MNQQTYSGKTTISASSRSGKGDRVWEDKRNTAPRTRICPDPPTEINDISPCNRQTETGSAVDPVAIVTITAETIERLTHKLIRKALSCVGDPYLDPISV